MWQSDLITRAMQFPAQTLSRADSTWMCLSHPNGCVPVLNAREWTMVWRKQQLNPSLSWEWKFSRERKSSASCTGKVLVTRPEQKQQLNLLQCLPVCWHFTYFTQQQPLLHFTFLYVLFTDGKKQTKNEKPLGWATVLSSTLDTAVKWDSYSIFGPETLRSPSNTLTVNIWVTAQQTTVSILWGTCIFGLTFLSLTPQQPHFCLQIKVVCSASLYMVNLQRCELQSSHTDRATRHPHNRLFQCHQVLWCICLPCLCNSDGICNAQSDVLPWLSLWNTLGSHYNACCP